MRERILLFVSTVISCVVGMLVMGIHHKISSRPRSTCKYEVARQKKIDQKNCKRYAERVRQIESAECGRHACWMKDCSPVQTIYMLAWQLAKEDWLHGIVMLTEKLPKMEQLSRVTTIEKFLRKSLKLNYDGYVTARFCDKNNRHTRNVILGNVVDVLLYRNTIQKAAVLFRRLHHENITKNVRWRYRERRENVKSFLLGAFYNRRKANSGGPPYRPIKPSDVFYACENFSKQVAKLERGMLRGLATVMAANPENQKRMLRAYRAIRSSKYTFENIKVIETMLLSFYTEWLTPKKKKVKK